MASAAVRVAAASNSASSFRTRFQYMGRRRQSSETRRVTKQRTTPDRFGQQCNSAAPTQSSERGKKSESDALRPTDIERFATQGHENQTFRQFLLTFADLCVETHETSASNHSHMIASGLARHEPEMSVDLDLELQLVRDCPEHGSDLGAGLGVGVAAATIAVADAVKHLDQILDDHRHLLRRLAVCLRQ